MTVPHESWLVARAMAVAVQGGFVGLPLASGYLVLPALVPFLIRTIVVRLAHSPGPRALRIGAGAIAPRAFARRESIGSRSSSC